MRPPPPPRFLIIKLRARPQTHPNIHQPSIPIQLLVKCLYGWFILTILMKFTINNQSEVVSIIYVQIDCGLI